MPNSFKGDVVIITGASSGIGANLAKELADQGAYVVLTARRLEKLNRLTEEILKKGQTAISVECDVNKKQDLDRAVKIALEKWGKVNTVVANAGFGVHGKFEDLTIEDYRRQFETNYFGVLQTLYASIDELKKTKGRFVIMSSAMGYFSMRYSSAYSGSKFALRALSQSLWEELYSFGVSVTLVNPGYVESEIRMVDKKGKFHDNRKDPVPKWIIMPAALAAKKIVSAMKQRKREYTFTIHARLLVWLVRFFPWFLTLLNIHILGDKIDVHGNTKNKK